MQIIPKSDLPLIQQVATAIVDDCQQGCPKDGYSYAASVAPLFPSNLLTLYPDLKKSWDDPAAIEAGSGFTGVSLKIGRSQANTPLTGVLKDEIIVIVGGALCHELAHLRQCKLDSVAFEAAACSQKNWLNTRATLAGSNEWLGAYYGSPLEFEAHAEQIAFEIWLSETLKGNVVATSFSLVTGIAGEAFVRIEQRLGVRGTGSVEMNKWFDHLEKRVNLALASW